jgi:hypothetical protein
MSTLRELHHSIKERIRQYTDDSDISPEYVNFLIKNARAMLIAQRYSSRQYAIPNKIKSHFHKALELSGDNEFVSGNGSVLRTTEPIVPMMEHHNLMTSLRISSGSYTDVNFSFVDASRFPFAGHNKWVQSHIYACLGTDNRLYFTSSNPSVMLLENVKLSYVVEDPEQAYPQTIEYNSAIDFWDVDYKIEESMVDQLCEVVVKKLVSMIQIPEDNKNDSASA